MEGNNSSSWIVSQREIDFHLPNKDDVLSIILFFLSVGSTNFFKSYSLDRKALGLFSLLNILFKIVEFFQLNQNDKLLARTSFSLDDGERHLQGCYIDHDSAESKMKYLKKRFKIKWAK